MTVAGFPAGQIGSPQDEGFPAGYIWWVAPVQVWGCPANDVDCTGDGIEHVYPSDAGASVSSPRDYCPDAETAGPAPMYYYA